MGYVLAYVQGLTADEEVNDLFCKKVVQDYLNDTDNEKHETVTLEELANKKGKVLLSY